MVSQFEELGLLPQFVQAVEQLGYEQPTPIQLAAIPALLGGRNVMGQAQTGTGKTAAFALPMLQGIQPGTGKVQALVLAPTRELAIQVAEATTSLASKTKVRVLAVYGGQSYQIQTRQLARGVDIVVGTPGRLLDLIRQKVLDLSQVHYLVLDEADEMLDMGFMEDVEAILAQVSAERQIALFSATLPDAVRRLADRYVSNPETIRINPTRPTVAETEQRFCRVREEDKLAVLTRILEVEEVKSALIFARTKARAQDLADDLIRRGYPAESLHGDLNQARREFVLNRFRSHTTNLMVATDVAARGLDIEDVSHVFNYDFPGDTEDYIHRIGRTGRAGRKGIAITFLTPRERRRIGEIESRTRQSISEFAVPKPEEVQAHRDERFLVRIYEQLVKGKTAGELSLVARLVEANVDLVDIAAAAIQMARAGEGILPVEEIFAPSYERAGGKRSASKKGVSVEQDQRVPKSERGGARKSPASGERQWKEQAPQVSHPRGQQEAGMVRLRMNLGDSHGLRPSDVVGAIASEVGIPGRSIGVIDIRRDYTFVDVAEKHVRRVLQESTGTYSLRGKPVMLTLAN